MERRANGAVQQEDDMHMLHAIISNKNAMAFSIWKSLRKCSIKWAWCVFTLSISLSPLGSYNDGVCTHRARLQPLIIWCEFLCFKHHENAAILASISAVDECASTTFLCHAAFSVDCEQWKGKVECISKHRQNRKDFLDLYVISFYFLLNFYGRLKEIRIDSHLAVLLVIEPLFILKWESQMCSDLMSFQRF